MRNKLREAADLREEWAGIPMPLQDQRMIISPRYPRAKELMEIGNKPPDTVPDNIKIRNTFYSKHIRCDIVIYEEDGKVKWGPVPAVHHFRHDLSTLGASFAWGIEQEGRALNLLGELIKPHAFKQYLLTGMFMETSKRSGLTYMFRKLKPTVVIDARGSDGCDSCTILCCLCLHPLGYYEGSWAGVMCPTDDVIAHLQLMRADEHFYWKSCNQHQAYRPEAGL